MSTKTNKSFSKRLKVTKNGKIMARAKGQNHFNAKQSGNSRRAKRGMVRVQRTKSIRNKFLSIG